jgi:ribonuclease HI
MNKTPNAESEKRTERGTSTVTIYTDGAAEPNPGPGGYGIVLIAGKHRLELSGGFQRTTNNRMELLGVIVALESLKRPCVVNLYSDSKYVVDSVKRGSLQRWERANWQRGKNAPVKNIDLWKRYLTAALPHKVQFHWVKGHAGIEENERCDVLAVAATKGGNLKVDVGYLESLKTTADSPTLSNLNLFNDSPESPKAPDEGHRKTKQPTPHPDPTPVNGEEPREGGVCRKCSDRLVKKPTKRKPLKPGQAYYYDWYLFCPGCGTMYMVNGAKRMVK